MFRWLSHFFSPNWIKVLDLTALDQLQKQKLKKLQFKGQNLLVICHRESIKVISNKCPHQGAPLDKEGVLEDGCIRCTRHQMRFPLEKGQGDLPLSLYETELREDGLYIKL